MSAPPIKPNREWPEPDDLVAATPPPPINRALAVFRVFLWLLPTGFALLSAWVIFGWIAQGQLYPSGFAAWGAAVLVFAIGVGWYHALLPRRGPRPTIEVIGDTLIFAFLQVFLVPILLGLVLFLTCATATKMFGI